VLTVSVAGVITAARQFNRRRPSHGERAHGVGRGRDHRLHDSPTGAVAATTSRASVLTVSVAVAITAAQQPDRDKCGYVGNE
jgi:ribosomal protein L27